MKEPKKAIIAETLTFTENHPEILGPVPAGTKVTVTKKDRARGMVLIEWVCVELWVYADDIEFA